jgi:hypothetical protein
VGLRTTYSFLVFESQGQNSWLLSWSLRKRQWEKNQVHARSLPLSFYCLSSQVHTVFQAQSSWQGKDFWNSHAFFRICRWVLENSRRVMAPPGSPSGTVGTIPGPSHSGCPLDNPSQLMHPEKVVASNLSGSCMNGPWASSIIITYWRREFPWRLRDSQIRPKFWTFPLDKK